MHLAAIKIILSVASLGTTTAYWHRAALRRLSTSTSLRVLRDDLQLLSDISWVGEASQIKIDGVSQAVFSSDGLRGVAATKYVGVRKERGLVCFYPSGNYSSQFSHRSDQCATTYTISEICCSVILGGVSLGPALGLLPLIRGLSVARGK